MRIRGLGVDIESVSRFRKKPFLKNKAFYERIFTQDEISYCLNKQDPSQHFAARFCAKEAFIKASKKKILDYRKIKIRVSAGKPYALFGRTKAMISLAHEKDKAIAFAIIR